MSYGYEPHVGHRRITDHNTDNYILEDTNYKLQQQQQQLVPQAAHRPKRRGQKHHDRELYEYTYQQTQQNALCNPSLSTSAMVTASGPVDCASMCAPSDGSTPPIAVLGAQCCIPASSRGVSFVVANDPQMSPALLKRFDPDIKDTHLSKLWHRLHGKSVAFKGEYFEKSHPAYFKVLSIRAGINMEISASAPETPFQAIIGPKNTFNMYKWVARDERGIHNAFLSEVTEYALQSPKGRLVFTASALAKLGLSHVALSLQKKTKGHRGDFELVDPLDTEDQEIVKPQQTDGEWFNDNTAIYGGLIPGTNDAYVFVQFDKYLDSSSSSAPLNGSELSSVGGGTTSASASSVAVAGGDTLKIKMIKDKYNGRTLSSVSIISRA